jgi:hypothetical protein
MAENNSTQVIPEQLQLAFDAVMAFQLPSTDQAFREHINSSAETESQSTVPLLLDENELTNGMWSGCIDQISKYRDEFLKLQGIFAAGLQPSRKKIDAWKSIDDEIANKQNEYDDIEASTIASKEANRQYADAKKNVTNLEEEYKVMYRAEGQREAKDFPLYLYIILLMLVGAAEWMVNYETFLNFTEVPLMAAGATILVALAVAYAAHFHGTNFKGHQYFFGDHIETAKKNNHIRGLIIVSIILILAFIGVGGARYELVAQQASQLGGGEGGLLGGDVVTINIGQVVSISMVINVFVWFIGAAIAYTVHDENPAFTDKFREFKKAKRIFDPLRQELDKKIAQLHAERNKKIGELKNTAKAHEQEAKPLADLELMVNEKNKKICSESKRLVNQMIRTYRSSLAQQAKVSNPDIRFNRNGELIDLETYRQLNIDFNFQNKLEDLV